MDKMDKLEDIFSSQQALDQEIIKRRNLPSFTKEEWLQKEVLALMSELAEVLMKQILNGGKNNTP